MTEATEPSSAPDNVTSACTTYPIDIPQSFINRFLWWPPHLFSVTANEQNTSSPTYEFPKALVAELQAVTSYAFLHAARTVGSQPDGLDAKCLTEQNITLCCPNGDSHDIIDSAVKLMAAHHRADVLVLDAFELAAGEFGALGKAARVIDSVYETDFELTEASGLEAAKDKEGKDFDTRHAQAFFDAIINISTVVDPGTNGEGLIESQPPRRIIYLRDFGVIARAARPLMTFLFQAMHNSRMSHKEAPVRVPRTTILVMGVTTPVDDSSRHDDGPFDPRPVRPSIRANANRHALSPCSMPTIRSEFPETRLDTSPQLFRGLAAQFFLPLAVDSSKLRHKCLPFDSVWKKAVNNKSPHGTVIKIFATNADPKAASTDKSGRSIDINNMLIRICLGGNGGLADELPSLAILKDDDERCRDSFQSSILSPSAADIIAKISVGLSYSEYGNAPTPIPVASRHIAEAHRVYLESEGHRKERITNDASKDLHQNLDEDPIVKRVKQSSDLSNHERDLLRCIVRSQSLSTTFDDVCIDPRVTERLRTIVSLPMLHPDHFRTGILAKESLSGVLLYGPPGTGKTMLCRALAHDCDARMLLLKPSDIHDKYIGESEKLAHSIFSLAQRLAPCVIFIDEVDALFATRSPEGNARSEMHRDLLTEFLQAMDGLQSAAINKEKGIVVVGATNRPFDIDQAILRRLPCRMMIDLPDERERLSILKVHLKEEELHKDVDLAEIAYETEDYSGSDLKNLCVSAAVASVKDIVGNFDWKPRRAEDSDNECSTRSPEEVSKVSAPRILTKAHFDHAFAEVAPSFSAEALAELYHWHEKFSLNPNVLDDVTPEDSTANPTPLGTNDSDSARLGQVLSQMSSFLNATKT